MKAPRRKEPLPPKGVIVDPETLSALISGLGCLNPEEPNPRRRRSGTLEWVKEFWKQHQPELVRNYNNASEDDQVMSFLIRANHKRHVDRRAFLLENNLLAGPALEKALKDKDWDERIERLKENNR
jgi:hypothetical protein